MNDFTKEELIVIRDNLVIAETREDNSILYNAYYKLLDMIDNYCKHECEHKPAES